MTGATPNDRRNSPAGQLTLVDNWLKKACPFNARTGEHECRYQPLVSFRFDRRPGREGYLPTPDVNGEYVQAVRAFMQRYPFVKTYTAWNEPNAPYQPSAKNHPATIAK